MLPGSWFPFYTVLIGTSDTSHRGSLPTESDSSVQLRRCEDRANFKNILMKALRTALNSAERACLLSVKSQEASDSRIKARARGHVLSLSPFLPFALLFSEEYVKYLDQVSVLDSLLAEEKKQVAKQLLIVCS